MPIKDCFSIAHQHDVELLADKLIVLISFQTQVTRLISMVN